MFALATGDKFSAAHSFLVSQSDTSFLVRHPARLSGSFLAVRFAGAAPSVSGLFLVSRSKVLQSKPPVSLYPSPRNALSICLFCDFCVVLALSGLSGGFAGLCLSPASLASFSLPRRAAPR